ncbi:unnamed protein product, partial [Meganyctiphanes norvegica]
MEGRLLNLKWNSHGAEFLTLLDDFRRKGLYTDATLACGDCIFHIHTVVLSVCSPFFAKIFHSTYCQNPIVVLQDVSAKQMENLLLYMYCGEVRVHQDELPSLLKVAESLQIKGLASSHSTDPAVVTSAKEEQIARWGVAHVEDIRSQIKRDTDSRSRIERGFERQILQSHYSYPGHYHYRGSTPRSSVSLGTRERLHTSVSMTPQGSQERSEEVASSSSPSQDRPHSLGSLSHERRERMSSQERPMSLPSTTSGHSPSAFHTMISSPQDVKTEPEERGEYLEESSPTSPAKSVIQKSEDAPASSSFSKVTSPSMISEPSTSAHSSSILSPELSLPLRSPHVTVSSSRHHPLVPETAYLHSPHLQGEMIGPPGGHFLYHPPKSLEITPHPFFGPSKDPQKHLREPPPLLKMPPDIRHPIIQPGSSHYPSDLREIPQTSQHSSHLLVKTLPIPPYRSMPSTSLPSPTSSFSFHIHNPQMGPISVSEGPSSLHDYPHSSSSLPTTLPGSMPGVEGPLNLSGQRSPASTTTEHANDPFLGKIITNRRKRLRGPKSWEFLVRLLKDPTTNPSLIRWENEANGIFRLVQPAIIAQRWGRRQGKHSSECLTYENFARGLRYHYATGALAPVSELSFVYKFGPKAEKLLKELKPT